MKNKFSRVKIVFFFTIFFTTVNGVFAQTVSSGNSEIRQIKISGPILATMKNGDFVYPRFSPDGKLLAYSNVIVEEIENTEVGLFDLQTQTKTILLNSKQAKKYAVYAAFVADLEWLALNKLRARISDGDVDSTLLTFNTRTRRVIKVEESNSGDEIDFNENQTPLAQMLYKTFPEIERAYISSAVNVNQAFKIENRGVVIQYRHADADTNIRFLDLRTKQSKLLLERPDGAEGFNLIGAVEINGNLLLAVEGSEETNFYLQQNGKIELIGKTGLGGWFEPKFAVPSKVFFLLKQPNNENEKPSSLWYFDGENLSLVSDVENLCDVDIDRTGKMIAFSYWNKAGKRDISVRKTKAGF